jgi:hypothetical protein
VNYVFSQGLRVVGSVVFDNAETSNSSKQRHGQPLAMKMGLMVSAPPWIA